MRLLVTIIIISSGNCINVTKHDSSNNDLKYCSVDLPNGSNRGDWRSGDCDNRAVFKWPNGEIYEGELNEGKRHGRGVHMWPSGHRYDGQWKNDERNGRVVFEC